MLDAFANWLSATNASAIVGGSDWIWPAAEVLHFIGLSLLLGVTGVFDLRLLGLFRGLPIGGLHRMMPWATLGFAINLVTGALFVVGKPLQYVGNEAFYFKMLFIAVAGANALAFELLVGPKALDVGAGGLAPAGARAIAAASLAAWVLVLHCGRMLAFIGDGAF